MRISLARLLLPLLLAFAFIVRWEPTRTLRLAADEQHALGGARWLIDDPSTCHELRRIELAIAGDRVPTHDRFVNFPADGEIPAFAFFDGAVAGIAQRVLRSPGGEAALGGVDERDLEDFVIKLAPILGLLAVLATYWAARTLAEGKRGDVAVLLATAFAAFHPALVASSAAGTLDSAALTTIVCALLLRSTVRSIRATTMPAALLDALVAGALAGILVSSSVVGLGAFVPAWIAFFVHARRSTGEARANALRSGIFFNVVAAFLARMSAEEGLLDEGRVVGQFAAGVSLLVFFAVAPYLLLILFDRDKKPSVLRVVCFVAALCVLALQVPTVWRQLAPAVTWFLSHRGLLASVEPEPTAHFGDIALLVLYAATILFVWWTWRRRADTAVLALAAFVVTLACASTISLLAVPLWAVAVACALARVLDEEVGSQRFVTIGACAVMTVFLVLSIMMGQSGTDAPLRQERLDFVAGLRWMRTQTVSGGPWNSPRTPSSWGVVSNVADGPLVLYHARRPALASPWGALSGPRALLETSERLNGIAMLDSLEHLMRGQGARYVVVAGRASRRDREPEGTTASKRTADAPHDRLLDAARAASDNSSTSTTGGFVLEHVSQRRVDARGRTTLDGSGRPVIAIWRHERSGAETPRAEMRPR